MKYRSIIILAALLSVFIISGASGVQIFSNTNYITINDSSNPPTLSAPYPSGITITNLPGQIVTKVTVTLQSFSHSFPSDVDILLRGPDGQTAVLMSEVGGLDQFSVTNLTITLDDSAGTSLPLDTALVSGTFKPTARHQPLPFDFPSPVPAGNSNSVAALSIFQNTDPNGTWSLFIVDDTAANDGSISNGWSLSLTTAPVLLQIQTANLTNALVSWPSNATNCTLQSSPVLSVPAWTDVTNPPALISGRLTITNVISNKTQFYRLRKGN